MKKIIIKTTYLNEVDPEEVENILSCGGRIVEKNNGGVNIGSHLGRDYFSNDEIIINGVTLPLSTGRKYDCTVSVNII